MIGVNINFLTDGIIVGAIIGDIQTTVAIYERQVTITIKTTSMTRTQGNEVTMVSIMDRSRHIAIHRSGVGIHRGRTSWSITTSKHGIANDDTCRIKAFPSGIGILVLQGVQSINRHIIILDVCTVEFDTIFSSHFPISIYTTQPRWISVLQIFQIDRWNDGILSIVYIIERNRTTCHLTMWFNQHLAVLCRYFFRTIQLESKRFTNILIFIIIALVTIIIAHTRLLTKT